MDDRGWRNRGQEHQKEREWNKEGIRNTDPEGGERQSRGWWWLWSHREAIEKSKEKELCMLGPGAELGTSIGGGGDNAERQRDTEKQRRKDKDKVKRKMAKEC